MKLIYTIQEASEYSKSVKFEGKTIGLVPTMGALHEGHLSLIKASQIDNDYTIASIFVNPIQFNNAADLEKYPRTLEADLLLLEKAGCHAVFLPTDTIMYKEKPSLKIDFGDLERVMEGKFRPGHFSGVGIVVAKFFNIILPDHAYFGQKDLQQFLVINRLVNDLSIPVKLHCCPIIREPDGLAMSSRNRRLSPQNRHKAAVIIQALNLGSATIVLNQIEKAKNEVAALIAQHKELELEYFEIADGENLQEVTNVANHKKIALCIAVYLDGVRLIDNMIITL